MNSKFRNISIAHVTAHIGGGVGSVLQDLFSKLQRYNIDNDLLCLDICRDNFNDFRHARTKLDQLANLNLDQMFDTVDYDLVVVHYWNHPLIAHFLSNSRLPACRLLIWSHISGLYEPNIIPSYLVNLSKKIMFSSECSYQAPNLKPLIKAHPQKFTVVHSARDTKKFQTIPRVVNTSFTDRRALYIGTVSKSKMHPKSAEIFAELSKSGFCIQVVGGPDQDILRSEVSDLGGSIETTGPVGDVSVALAWADVFVYPLNPYHYGTGEQVILEAMASGLPVVAFNNPAESVLVLDNDTGILVQSVTQFVAGVKLITENINVYKRMSERARIQASSVFSIENMINSFIDSCIDVLDTKKEIPRFDLIHLNRLTVIELYALHALLDSTIVEQIRSSEAIGINAMLSSIKDSIRNHDVRELWSSDWKASPKQYEHYFPGSNTFLTFSQGFRELIVDSSPNCIS